jgi:ketosteroid isomerase-like protein
MKRVGWFAIGVAFAFGLVSVVAQSGAAQKQARGMAPSAADAAVLKADSDRFAAMQKADVAALEKLLGDELSYTHTSGVVQTKAQFIGDIKSGTIKYLSVEPTDRKVMVFGNTAVVTGGGAVHIILNGNDMSFKIRYTNVHVNRGGAWQMVAWEATRLPA